ncbi:transmembrane protein 269 isoform X2 [Cuculus canorus]|uniref:transmembrane protein 269 isoform X2 n=1 Tax=Cuculus canorus TaxID=55661 RepID=UPI0023AA8919|nr:transmembrane protein 269 isoform X2 [Cuculus canorus]
MTLKLSLKLSPIGVFQATTKKLFLSERAGQGWMLEFIRKNAANGLSVANLVAGLSSILCSLNRWGEGRKEGNHRGHKVGVTPVSPSPGNTSTRVGCCWWAFCSTWPTEPLLAGSTPARRWVPNWMILPTSPPSGWPQRCCCSRRACWPGCWPSPTCWPYSLASASSPALNMWHPAGIPFTYRGLPCPYASSLLAGTFLLADGNVIVLRITAGVMILFMLDQGFYPHDKVLESQRWKKVVYAGGKDRARIKTHRDGSREGADPKGSSQSAGVAAVLFLPTAVASVYCLVWAMSYIVFPFAVWSCKAQPNA